MGILWNEPRQEDFSSIFRASSWPYYFHFAISPFHHFTIKCWNHPTFYFHFNPQNKAVWWTLPHLTFPSEISGGPMRLMPRRRKSNPCMAKSPRCVGAKHLMMSCQVGRLVPVCRGDHFFLGRNLSNPPKTRSLIWLVKGMVKAPYQLLDIKQLYIYIYIIYSIYSIYSESSKNTGKTCGKDGTLGKSESNPSFSQMLDILTSWCPLQCLQQWWSSPGKLKFSKGADRQMIRVVLYKHYHLRFKQHQQKHAGMRYVSISMTISSSNIYSTCAGGPVNNQPKIATVWFLRTLPKFGSKQFPLHFTLVPKNHKKKTNSTHVFHQKRHPRVCVSFLL